MSQTFDESLRSSVDELADQLCAAVHGQFDFRVNAPAEDETIEKLEMLINFVLDSARRAVQEAKQSQMRAVRAESATTLSRLVAALSHELNSPLGVVSSSASTLARMADKMEGQSPERCAALALAAQELCRSIESASARMTQVVGRIRRFSDVERETVQSLDLTDQLGELARVVIEASHEDVVLEANLPPLRPVQGRPLQLASVFSLLLEQAVAATPKGGCVRLTGRQHESHVAIEISREGESPGADEASRLFEPYFQIEDGRVGSGGWGLFSARQIIHEHEGEIRIRSEGKRGFATIVSLPC